MSRHALVTGGAGFIGSHLTNRLLRAGWSVDVVDNLSTGKKSNVPELARFILADVSDQRFTEILPADHYDVVFHLAAQSSGEVSFDDPILDLQTNCASTLSLLRWCLDTRSPRFIFASSMSVYGEQGGQPVTEETVIQPRSFYGVGKRASELYMKIYEQPGLDVTALRLFNVYGPGQNLDNLRQGMVSIYMAFLANQQEIVVKGSADRFRDFIYIDDVIDAFMVCVAEPNTFGRVFNVGTGIKTTVKELVSKELLAFDVDPASYPVRYERGTPGDIHGIVADISSLTASTGWHPETSLEDGLKRMAQWACGGRMSSF